MVNRDKFQTVVVPADFEKGTQEALELLFSKKPPKGSRALLLVEKVRTLGRLGSLFPEQKVRIIVFDVAEELEKVQCTIPDLKKEDDISKLVSLKPGGLNSHLVKMRTSALEDYRREYQSSDAVTLASREGKFKGSLEGASNPLKKSACEFLLGVISFAGFKRACRKDSPRISRVVAVAQSDYGNNLIYAFMDVALYGTESKEAALFADADLEDLRYVVSLLTPEADMKFPFGTPDKLRLARE
jgi:hypothetical protein